MNKKTILLCLYMSCVAVFGLLLSTSAFAAHPLITDDTGTHGKGKFQLEVNGEYGHEKEDGATENTAQIEATLTYGMAEYMDIVLGMPYQRIRTKDSGASFSEEGLSGIALELKWRFYEKDGLSFAFKPGITLPAGDDKKALGAGRAGYSLFFITSKEVKPWDFHLNLGYIRTENRNNQRKHLWHASLASTMEVIKDLKLAANIGIEKDPDKESRSYPAFILGGIIYSASENFDIDFGIKGGLNKPETDYSILAGITLRF